MDSTETLTVAALTAYLGTLRERANAALEDESFALGFALSEVADELAAMLPTPTTAARPAAA